MKIWCCGCGQEVDARLTSGNELYPHRKDLASLPFWICECGLFVGCHHKTSKPTTPLGVIATKEIKNARQHIHRLIDPIWKDMKIVKRGKLYAMISKELGYQYHTAEIRSIEQAREVWVACKKVIGRINEDLNQLAMEK